MRAPVDQPRLLEFLRALGHAARQPGRLYLTGGASAVLVGWRDSTIDIDVALSASLQPLLHEIPALKERLAINVELASPSDFIPEVPGWEQRSTFIVREGVVDVFHYDFHSQALSKLERGHAKDLADVAAMQREGLVDPELLLALLARIEPELYRYPAIDPPTFRRAVERFARPG